MCKNQWLASSNFPVFGNLRQNPRRCGIAACVARALQRCPGRACLAFLFRPQEVRRVDNTCTQCDPKTLGSLVHYIPSCRTKGKCCDTIFGHKIVIFSDKWVLACFW